SRTWSSSRSDGRCGRCWASPARPSSATTGRCCCSTSGPWSARRSAGSRRRSPGSRPADATAAKASATSRASTAVASASTEAGAMATDDSDLWQALLAVTGDQVATEADYEHGYKREMRSDLLRYVTFMLGSEIYALPIEQIIEISTA